MAGRSIFTIPSSDAGFARHVEAVYARHADATPADFERRLRRIFPRVVVRQRSVSGEEASWYVYRDGAWRPESTGPWWTQHDLPRVVASADGWLVDVSSTARDLLGVAAGEPPRHFTDFVVPGALDDAVELFRSVAQGNQLDATVLLRPTSGDVIAVDMHVTAQDDLFVGVLRLAEDVDIPGHVHQPVARPSLEFLPATDVAFRAYAQRALERMPEPTTIGLELRLRQLYPHASVSADGDTWTVRRDRASEPSSAQPWWIGDGLPRVRYDGQGLILDANDAAREMFGRPLVGQYWQEFVTPGSSEQVAVMLEILGSVGAAESRFRIPRPDGSLLEFDSYTEVVGDEFSTAYRPVDD